MEGTESESTPFRISVCLKAFFSDERARCYVSVSRARRVAWLQRRLRRLLPLPAAFCLLLDGHLLPPDETLALLRPDDRLTAMPTENKECYPADEDDSVEMRHVNGAERQAGGEGGGEGGEAGGGRGERAGDEAEALREAKRRALADLDTCGPPARRPRHRVRRRKARAAGGDGPDHYGSDGEAAGAGGAGVEGAVPPWAPRGPPPAGCRTRPEARGRSPPPLVMHRGHMVPYGGLPPADT